MLTFFWSVNVLLRIYVYDTFNENAFHFISKWLKLIPPRNTWALQQVPRSPPPLPPCWQMCKKFLEWNNIWHVQCTKYMYRDVFNCSSRFSAPKRKQKKRKIYPLLSWPGVAEQEGSLVKGNQGEESRDRIENAPFGFVLCRPFRCRDCDISKT